MSKTADPAVFAQTPAPAGHRLRGRAPILIRCFNQQRSAPRVHAVAGQGSEVFEQIVLSGLTKG